MTVHSLEIWPEFFEPVLNGEKTFELRKNDRDYKVGDVLLLREFEPSGARAGFTGREIGRRVCYVMIGTGGIEPLKGLSVGYCILGLTGWLD